MADRIRRVRRQISDATEESSSESHSDSGDDWVAPSSTSKRLPSGKLETSAVSRSLGTSRPRRTTASVSTTSTGSSATVYKSTSPEDRRQSIRLTVKVPPSRLREVMRANEVESLQDTLGGGRVIDGPRNRKAAASSTQRASGRRGEKPRYVEYGESEIEDEDEGDEEEEEEEEEELEEYSHSEAMNDFDEVGAEAEGGTDEELEEEEEEDVDMEDAIISRPSGSRQRIAPKPPKITLKAPSKTETTPLPKPRLVVTPATLGPLKSVEDQEMEDDPGDEEVEAISELSQDETARNGILNEENEEELDEEEEDEEEGEGEGEDEELEGEEEEEDEEDEDEDEDDEDDSDETPASGMATPDLSRMTKRQRGRPEDQGQLLALDMAPQQRKFFTDEEKAMKKDEHARKRKELTKRKTQEEKTTTLNRLLKPQVPKSRGLAPKPDTLAAAPSGASAAAASPAGPADEEEYVEKPNLLFTRWISDASGIRLGVPEEWLGKRVGAVFGGPRGGINMATGSPLVQEIE